VQLAEHVLVDRERLDELDLGRAVVAASAQDARLLAQVRRDKVETSADLALRGTPADPVLSGTVTVRNASYRRTIDLSEGLAAMVGAAGAASGASAAVPVADSFVGSQGVFSSNRLFLAVLGIAIGTCKAQLHRARALMRERIEHGPKQGAIGGLR
jgi:hypothetical protein